MVIYKESMLKRATHMTFIFTMNLDRLSGCEHGDSKVLSPWCENTSGDV